MIDFRDLIRKHSFAEHAARADKYFSSLDINSPVARKPFASAHEAAELCSGVSALLPGLMLFPTAKVLDFGAGTCWLTRLLAMLGCEVTAVDVSRKALEIGEQLIRSDPIGPQLKVDFTALDSPDLPFADGTFDRVICFDALHHVPSQEYAIREFARVLKPGGIAALHEPGPSHSRSSQSQFEMRMHDVIEADVHVETLFAAGREAGFTRAEMAIHGSRSIRADLREFNEFLSSPHSSAKGRELGAQVAAELENRRIFFLSKGDPLAFLDSRSTHGLNADLRIGAELTESGVRISGCVENIGSNTWLPSFSGLGAVNIGVHLLGEDRSLVDADYFRAKVSADPVAPGTGSALSFEIPHPSGRLSYEFTIDLVSEGVMWFEIGGSKTVRIAVTTGPGSGVKLVG